MADRNHLLLCLALGADTAKRVEKIPLATHKEQGAANQSRSKGNVNSPGRS